MNNCARQIMGGQQGVAEFDLSCQTTHLQQPASFACEVPLPQVASSMGRMLYGTFGLDFGLLLSILCKHKLMYLCMRRRLCYSDMLE